MYDYDDTPTLIRTSDMTARVLVGEGVMSHRYYSYDANDYVTSIENDCSASGGTHEFDLGTISLSGPCPSFYSLCFSINYLHQNHELYYYGLRYCRGVGA